MTSADMLDVWTAFDAAQAMMEREEGPPVHSDSGDSGDSDDEEDNWGNSAAATKDMAFRSSVCRLPCGDIHVCDCDCPYGTPGLDAGGRPTGDVVCVYTGCVVSRSQVERTDFSTGRSMWSADPDVNCGMPQGGGWRKKRDMTKASQQAYCSATTLDDSEMPKAVESTLVPRVSSKRGALCVDEAAPVDTGPKKQRSSKKQITSFHARAALVSEATTIFSKLVGKAFARTCQAPAQATIDPRLLNRDLLYTAALKKYLKETLASGGFPAIDNMHNIALAVDKVIREEQRKIDGASSPTGVSFRDMAARMAVALWMGACQTPYLSTARRGADSFRPFCAGAFYAFKRGLTLSDGTVLVRQCPVFADSLPSSRVIAADPVIKSLHASSHRGLCTIHRCIASVDVKTAHRIFTDAIALAK